MLISVKELHSRIAAVSARIDLQKAVLNQLEVDKRALYRQLNAICDPISRLPTEISSEIFRYCLPISPCAATAPMLLLQICSSWADIALSTPALWSTIHVGGSRVEFLQLWLERAQNYPRLTISLAGALDSDVANIVVNNAARLKHLVLDQAQNLDPLLTAPFPCLETVLVRGNQWEEEDDSDFSLAQLLKLLCLSPNLVECTLDKFATGDYLDPAAEPQVLPRLKCLKFGDTENQRNITSQDDILPAVSLPSLETLFLSFRLITNDDFFQFLERSMPPLQKLVIADDCRELVRDDVVEWLHLLPALVHLELPAQTGSFVNELGTALAHPASRLIPHLRTMSFHCRSAFAVQPPYQTLLQLLSNRRDKLIHFHLTGDNSSIGAQPELQIRDEFRQLARGGMEIYIGTHSANFVCI
ncbi:hypothetical protein C8R46DRAFT_77019 [Mycena filopes]|nr:hypothetical protein C8R46DRAFT_77019 [Mycena filopes]